MAKYSVALCTYNGEKYIEQQLASIAAQTLPPTEIIICDDASTDRTVALCRAFAQTVPFAVHIHENERPLRVTKNFEKALLLCNEETIFLSDQDDFWLPHKAAELAGFLFDNQSVEMVFSDAQLTDEHLSPVDNTQWRVVRFHEEQQQIWGQGGAVEIMLGGNRITGCTVALRRSLVVAALPFPTHIKGVIHDNWLAWVATLRGTIAFTPQKLTYYRQHEAQQVGSKPKPQGSYVGLKQRISRPRAEKLAPLLAQWQEHQELLEALAKHEVRSDLLQQLQQKTNYLHMRSHLPGGRVWRVWPVLKALSLGHYHRYKDQEADAKAPWKAAIGDILE